MTTTACDDQFSAEPEPVHQPYDVAAILRKNIADLEKELQRQREQNAAATERLREQIERVTSEWERAENDVAAARSDLQSFIDSRNGWMERAGAAEAELLAVREDNHSMMLEINSLRATAPSVADCRACANRGRINGLSQESYCDSCIYQGRDWRKNHFVDASKTADAVKRRCDACAVLPCSCE